MNKWVIRLFLSIIGIIVIAVGVYAFNVYRDVTDVMEAIYTPDVADTIDMPTETEIIAPTETEEVDEIEVDLSIQEPISILILGIDTDEFGEHGLPDSIIVVTVNPEEETTKMVSIPRDIKTEIVGMYFDDKVNHAYAFGGIEMMINTVESLLDIPINYYAKVNMTGFQELIDVVEGVEVENDLDFTFDGKQFPLGVVHLSGADALKFTRMRQDDPLGDFGRQQRQRLVIKALFNELVSFESITQFSSILDTVREHLETNIALDDAAAMLFGGYRGALENIEHMQLLTGEGQIINGVYFQILSDEEIADAQATLRTHLDLEEEVLD